MERLTPVPGSQAPFEKGPPWVLSQLDGLLLCPGSSQMSGVWLAAGLQNPLKVHAFPHEKEKTGVLGHRGDEVPAFQRQTQPTGALLLPDESAEVISCSFASVPKSRTSEGRQQGLQTAPRESTCVWGARSFWEPSPPPGAEAAQASRGNRCG